MAETIRTSSIKEEVIEMIRHLPADCTLEQIQYHLYVGEQVERGIADIEAGRVVSQEEAKRRIAEWRFSRYSQEL
jgi:predicted transcriptional regulator